MSEYLIVIGVVLAAGIAAVVSRQRRRRGARYPPLGIVLLLSRAKPLESPDIATLFGRVTETRFDVVAPRDGRSVKPADLPVGNAVLGGPPSFLVQAEGDLFVVNSVANPTKRQIPQCTSAVFGKRFVSSVCQ